LTTLVVGEAETRFVSASTLKSLEKAWDTARVDR